MIGLALQVRLQCGSCGGPLPLNALVEQVLCPACQAPRSLDPDAWRTILEDAIKEAPQLAPEEGRSSTIFGPLGQVELTYGHQHPRCPSCKTELPVEDIDVLVARGWARCVGCGRRHALRRPPAVLAGQLPPGALLAFEDEDQIAGLGSGVQTPAAAKPVVFPCPQCAAALPIDGQARTVNCTFCHADVYLPDDLWLRLHPVRTVERWYAWFDEATVLLQWDDLYDAAIDRQGNLYCAGELASGGTALWSLEPTLRTRWSTAVELDDGARLTLTPNGFLLVGNPRQHALLVLACADGTIAGKVGGTTPNVLDYEDAQDLCGDTDGTILVLTGDEIRRYSPDGARLESWQNTARRSDEAPPLESLRERPPQVQTDATHVAPGWDGFTYLWDATHLVKLSRWGQIVWRVKLPFSINPRPWAVANGGMLLLGDSVFGRLAPDGRFQALRPIVGGEKHLAVAPDGTAWLLGYGSRLRVIGSDGAQRYVSPRSQEEEAAQTAEGRRADW
jgi:hypothetical protein